MQTSKNESKGKLGSVLNWIKTKNTKHIKMCGMQLKQGSEEDL